MCRWPLVRVVGSCVALVAILAAGSVVAIAQNTPAPSDNPPPPAKSDTVKTPPAKTAPAVDLTDQLTKQMNVITEQLSNLLTDELKVGIEEEKNVAAASQNLGDLNAVAENLFKGKPGKDAQEWKHDLEYKQALMAAAAQWQQLFVKLGPIVALGKALERDKAKAPADLQPLIEQLLGRIDDKSRNMQEKLGDLNERGGEYKRAVGYYTALYQSIPEAKRAGERKLLHKIVTLYASLGDAKDALSYYQALQAALPENERNKDGGLGLRICDALEKTNDYRTELQLLKALHDANPGDKGVSDRIAKIEKKVGGH